jgi:hypothetical protein
MTKRASSGASSVSAGPSPRAPGATPPAIRPTLGTRPLHRSVAVQRDTSEAGAGNPAEPATPGPVAARWPSGGDLPATIEALPQPRHSEDPVPLQRLAAPTPSPATPSAGEPPAMREIVFPAPGVPATAMTGVTPAAFPGSPVIQRSASTSTPSLRRGTPPPARTAVEPALNLVRPSPPAAVGVATVSTAPGASPQRIVDPPSASSSAPAVQATRPGPSTVPDISVTPVIQRIDGSAPAPQPGPGGGARSDKELDELAQALFGRLRTRLRTEVIHEREARGLGFDAF